MSNGVQVNELYCKHDYFKIKLKKTQNKPKWQIPANFHIATMAEEICVYAYVSFQIHSDLF